MNDVYRGRLGDLVSIKHGFAFPGSGFSDNSALPMLLTPGNFALGGGFQGGKTRSFAGDFDSAYVLSPGDLVVSMTDLSREGATLGNLALVPSEGIYLHNQRIGLVSILRTDLATKEFLNYRLRLPDYRTHILGTATGSTVRHTSPDRIKAFPLVLPPIERQRAIAEVLGALDDKIAANGRLAGLAFDLARESFRQQTANLPGVSLTAFAEPLLGGTPNRAEATLWRDEVAWASARDVSAASHGIIVKTMERISGVASAGANRLAAHPRGSVVLTARGTVGAVARLAIPAAINQSCYAFEPTKVRAAPLYFSVLAAVDRLQAMAHGSVFSTVTMDTLERVEVADARLLPPDVVAKLEALSGVNEGAALENQTLAELRDTLLPELMSGRLRVREAERAVEEVL